VNVSQLNDIELIAMLEERGADVGPITETTRVVYKKKLLKLLDNEQPVVRTHVSVQQQQHVTYNRQQQRQLHDEDEDNDESEDDEDEDDNGSRYKGDHSEPDSHADDMRSHWRNDTRLDDIRQRQTARSDSPRLTSYLPKLGESSWTSHKEQTSTASARYVSDGVSGGSTGRDSLSRGGYVSRDDYISPRGDTLTRPPIAPQADSAELTTSKCCPVWLQFLVLVLFSISLFVVLQCMDEGWIHPLKYVSDLWGSTDKKQ